MKGTARAAGARRWCAAGAGCGARRRRSDGFSAGTVERPRSTTVPVKIGLDERTGSRTDGIQTLLRCTVARVRLLLGPRHHPAGVKVQRGLGSTNAQGRWSSARPLEAARVHVEDHVALVGDAKSLPRPAEAVPEMPRMRPVASRGVRRACATATDRTGGLREVDADHRSHGCKLPAPSPKLPASHA